MNNFLFKHIDNSALIVFRIIFGLLVFLESIGAIFTGWVKRTLIEPEFTFSFIGFEWLQPLPGNWMYLYYVIMGMFGLLVMVGYKYRWSVITFTIMWAMTYLMQKSSYNNHYYLLILLSGIMAILPANTYLSVDAKLNPGIKSNSMPQWCSYLLIAQMLIVYTYGAIAKIYPDWLDTTFMEILLKSKEHYYIIGDLLQSKSVHYFLVYGGILFDGLVIPLLLYKPTRNFALYVSIFFHLFNSIVFQVGIFPYLSLAFILFFYEPKVIQTIFLEKKSFYDKGEVINDRNRKPFLVLITIYLLVQLILPIRHWFIDDNVLWTEEGHRMSWRMMLRSKSGRSYFYVIDKNTNKKTVVDLNEYLTKKQKHQVSTKPDVIWQFAQRIKQQYESVGQDVSVYVDSYISVNGRTYKKLIDPETDLANIEWNAFKHSPWLLPSNLD
jgi:hypothetical protein